MTRIDLDAILGEVLTHFAPIRKRFHVDWVDLDDAAPEDFEEKRDLACVIPNGSIVAIGIHPKLKRAPKFVIRYLVFHEVLHVALKCLDHPFRFNVAERLWPDYQRANVWLSRFYREHGLV